MRDSFLELCRDQEALTSLTTVSNKRQPPLAFCLSTSSKANYLQLSTIEYKHFYPLISPIATGFERFSGAKLPLEVIAISIKLRKTTPKPTPKTTQNQPQNQPKTH